MGLYNRPSFKYRSPGCIDEVSTTLQASFNIYRRPPRLRLAALALGVLPRLIRRVDLHRHIQRISAERMGRLVPALQSRLDLNSPLAAVLLQTYRILPVFPGAFPQRIRAFRLLTLLQICKFLFCERLFFCRQQFAFHRQPLIRSAIIYGFTCNRSRPFS